MSLLPSSPAHAREEAIWQDVEYGSYSADLPLWRELAEAAVAGPVLELGAGSGRVALDLARAGRDVVAVELDEVLAGELSERAEGLPLRCFAGDASALLPLWEREGLDPAGLAIAPLQVLQLLDADARAAALASLAAVLAPGATAAVALVDEESVGEPGAAVRPPAPDMREVEGWVYSSEPLWVQIDDEQLRMRRLRQRVSPRGDMVRRVHDDVLFRVSPAALEREAHGAGLRALERRPVGSTEHEAGSVVVILGAP